MESGTYETLLLDITGKRRIESEDPRWTMLFRCRPFDRDHPGDILALGTRLQVNNPGTGNLLQLLDQASARVRQSLSHHNK
jgi:hypothetical protein